MIRFCISLRPPPLDMRTSSVGAGRQWSEIAAAAVAEDSELLEGPTALEAATLSGGDGESGATREAATTPVILVISWRRVVMLLLNPGMHSSPPSPSTMKSKERHGSFLKAVANTPAS